MQNCLSKNTVWYIKDGDGKFTDDSCICKFDESNHVYICFNSVDTRLIGYKTQEAAFLAMKKLEGFIKNLGHNITFSFTEYDLKNVLCDLKKFKEYGSTATKNNMVISYLEV